jgi:hypothetical protein
MAGSAKHSTHPSIAMRERTKQTFVKIKTKTKTIWSIAAMVPLSHIPQIKTSF